MHPWPAQQNCRHWNLRWSAVRAPARRSPAAPAHAPEERPQPRAPSSLLGPPPPRQPSLLRPAGTPRIEPRLRRPSPIPRPPAALRPLPSCTAAAPPGGGRRRSPCSPHLLRRQGSPRGCLQQRRRARPADSPRRSLRLASSSSTLMGGEGRGAGKQDPGATPAPALPFDFELKCGRQPSLLPLCSSPLLAAGGPQNLAAWCWRTAESLQSRWEGAGQLECTCPWPRPGESGSLTRTQASRGWTSPMSSATRPLVSPMPQCAVAWHPFQIHLPAPYCGRDPRLRLHSRCRFLLCCASRRF